MEVLGRLGGGVHCCGEGAVELSGDVALKAASDLSHGFAFCGASRDIGPGLGAAAHPVDGDGVDRSVEGPVAAPVQAVSGYRNASLNACSNGAPASAHRMFFALDLVPVGVFWTAATLPILKISTPAIKGSRIRSIQAGPTFSRH